MAVEYSDFAESEYEALGDADAYELSEARRRQPRPRPSTGQSAFRPRPQTGQFVTQAQLQIALDRVGAQIRTNSNAIRDASSRVSTAEATLRREIAARSRTSDQTKRDIQQVATISALMPMLTQPQTISVPGSSLGKGSSTTLYNVLVDTPGMDIADILPLLFLGNIGGAPGGGGMGGGDNTLLLAIAMLASGGGLNRSTS